MQDLSIPYLVVDFFRQDPVRALGVIGFACVAISATTNFDLMAALGFVDIHEDGDQETSAA